MIRVIANIRLYRHGGRKIPFTTGYRPLFSFIEEMKTSGKITLKGMQEFSPGDEAIVEITFLNKKYLGNNFGLGTKFTFGEGREPLGEGEIKEIIK